MENVKYRICYWYHEYQDMSASVPTCDYYRQYGERPCEPECKHFITKKEIDDIVRKEEEWIQAIAEVLLKVPPTEPKNKLYVKIYADDEPFVKAEKLYQICGETQNREVAEWLKEYFPSTDDNWIPVSDRLPSESGDYLCTIPLDADETYTEVLTFHEGKFYEDDDEYGATYHDDVLAWMPLPIPYKGGDDK